MGKQLSLDDVVLLGRTFGEYAAMFKLDEEFLADRSILDVASGVSSFCAEANAMGFDVTASDRIYAFEPSEIERKCRNDLENVLAQLPGIMDLYKWDYFESIEALRDQRTKAYRLFLKDFQENKSRYVPVVYPQTFFETGQFTTALVSHFLFLYEDQLDYGFHKQTLIELLRVASRDVRIFPLVNLKGERSRYLGRLLEDEDFAGVKAVIQEVPYEFMLNGNEMLRLMKQ